MYRMEDVLDLYAQPRDATAPLVCFDETFKQLVLETRTPIPAKPGSAKCVDYEYRVTAPPTCSCSSLHSRGGDRSR